MHCRYCTGTHSSMMSRSWQLWWGHLQGVHALLQLIASIMPIAFGKSTSLYLQTLLGHTGACLWDTFQLKLRLSPQWSELANVVISVTAIRKLFFIRYKNKVNKSVITIRIKVSGRVNYLWKWKKSSYGQKLMKIWMTAITKINIKIPYKCKISKTRRV